MNIRRIIIPAMAAAIALAGCASTSTGGGAEDAGSGPDAGAGSSVAGEPSASTGSPSEDGQASGDAAPETITITDHTGEEITIPADIQRVVVDEIPIASTLLAYHHGSAPYLVGMPGSYVEDLRHTIVAEMAPEMLDVQTGYDSNGQLNIETLLAMNPDVVFYNANNTEHKTLFEQAGISAVGFSTNGDPTTVYADWLRLLEKVFQEPGKMDETITYGETLTADAQRRSAQIADADRKSALIVFNYSSGTLRVAGDTPFFGYYWLKTANAINAAVGTTQGLAPVNAEQVLAWDPDHVLIGGAGQAGITVEQVLGNQVDGLDLSALRAVKQGRVNSNQLGVRSWFTPNPDAPVIANWIGSVIYPDQFGDVDLTAMAQDYYQKVYGYELSAEQAAELLRGDTTA